MATTIIVTPIVTTVTASTSAVEVNIVSGPATTITANALSISRTPYVQGVATLDFGAGAMEASAIVTGISLAEITSFATAELRIEATADHSVSDLLYDPIRLQVHDMVAGVGFTITGMMDNAPANGTYTINWILY